MKIATLLQGLAQEKPAPAPSEKLAEERPGDTKATPREALLSALHAAAATEKTAAAAPAPGPVEDLMKVAAELAESEKAAAIKEAALLGEAFADAAIARISTWQKSAAAMLTEGAAGPTNEQLKEAAAAGYRQARAELEKGAEEEYTRGWNETVEAVYKLAADEFLKASAGINRLLQAA